MMLSNIRLNTGRGGNHVDILVLGCSWSANGLRGSDMLEDLEGKEGDCKKEILRRIKTF